MFSGWDTYTFLQTAAIGFAFGVICLCSGNTVLPMALHFVYDIIADLTGFIEWNGSPAFTALNSVFEIMLGVMFAISALLLMIKKQPEQ